jgi:L-ascorbate metabolism protein UlaG (beta-lactamase superfamily)
MGVDDAVIACSYIAPKIVVPIHYDTFPHIKADPQDFARQIMLENYAVPKVLKS